MYQQTSLGLNQNNGDDGNVGNVPASIYTRRNYSFDIFSGGNFYNALFLRSNDNGVTDLPLGCDKKLAPMFIVGTWLSNANCRTWLGFSRRGSFVFVVKTKSHSPPLISAPTLWFSQCLYYVPTANFAPKCKNQQSFNGFSKSVVKPHFANICSAIFSWFPNRHEELAFSTPVVRMQGGSKERIGRGAKRSRGYAQVSIKVWRFF